MIGHRRPATGGAEDSGKLLLRQFLRNEHPTGT